MAVNRGKDFENVIKEAFLKVPNISVDRLHDQTTGFKGSTNICDFIVYKYPVQYYIECKSVHGGTLPFSNITDNQRKGMFEKSQIPGVKAGIICWYIDKDMTIYYPIEYVVAKYMQDEKSLKFKDGLNSFYGVFEVPGKKKRVFFDYDMERFFSRIGHISVI